MFGEKKKERAMEAQLQEKNEETKEVSSGTKIKAYIKIATVVILLLAAVVTVLLLVFGNSPKPPQIYAYVNSKNALYIGEVQNPEKIQMLTDSYYMFMWQEKEPAFKEEIRFSKDGKKIYFPANKTQKKGLDTFELFVRDYDDPEQEAVLLAQNVCHYEVTGDGKVVYRVANGSLHVISEGETVCLADEKATGDFWLDDKEKNVIWTQFKKVWSTKNGTYASKEIELYYADLALKKKSKKLEDCGEWPSIPYISDDFKWIYFIEDGNLYLIRNLGKKEKIASDVYASKCPCNQGKGWYYTVKDEKGENDTLYYFNGKKSVLIEENLEWVWPFEFKEGFIGFAVKDDDRHLYLAQGEEITRVSLGRGKKEWWLSSRLTDEDSKQVYITIFSEERGSTLYQLSYAKGKVGTITDIDDEIYKLLAAKAGKCYYVKESKNKTYGEMLYCDGEVIAENTRSVMPYQDGVYYMTDYDYTFLEGSLKKYEKGREKLVAEQVFDYIPINGKSAFVETDYSVTAFTLSHYNGKKCKVIAERVRIFDVLN